jgi:hypothetical protein
MMKHPPAGFWLILSIWVYKSLIFALPKEFRQNYAAEMKLVFRDCCREAYTRNGVLGIFGELTNGVLDLAISAVKERIFILGNEKHSLSFFLVTTTLAIAGGASAAIANLHNDETANPLWLILGFSFALAFIHPRIFWLSGLLIGLMMPAIHFLALIRGWHVDYPTDSSTPLWAFLALIPALISSLAGAGFRLILKYIRKLFN